jgi:hypothetical protein
MRLLIYLLALLSGFSAAEAARPVSASSSAVGAATQVANVLVVATQVCTQRAVALAGVETPPPVANLSLISSNEPVAVPASTPVSRFDSARE